MRTLPNQQLHRTQRKRRGFKSGITGAGSVHPGADHGRRGHPSAPTSPVVHRLRPAPRRLVLRLHRASSCLLTSLPSAPAHHPRTGIALTDPGPHRINPADRFFPIIGEERTGRHAGFGVLDLAALGIHDKPVCIQETLQVHLQVISHPMRIQFRPGNPYLLAAAPASLTVE